MCSEHFPKLFFEPEAKRICGSLDYDFADKRGKIKSAAGMFYYFRTTEVKKLFQVIVWGQLSEILLARYLSIAKVG